MPTWPANRLDIQDSCLTVEVWPFPPRAVRRLQMARHAILAEIRALPVSSGRCRVVPRVVKRNMSDFPLRPRRAQPTRRADATVHLITRHRPLKITTTRRHSQLNSLGPNAELNRDGQHERPPQLACALANTYSLHPWRRPTVRTACSVKPASASHCSTSHGDATSKG